MIATLSPGSNSTDHTVNTMRYADRIKEKKVGNALAPSNRSLPGPSMDQAKNLPVKMQIAAATEAPLDEDDDYDDDEFDELEEITNSNFCTGDKQQEISQSDELEPHMSEIDQAVKQLLEEEEHLLNVHMKSIHEQAELMTEEGGLLQSVQGENYDIDDYATRLGEILDRKTALIQSLQVRLGTFRELLRKEEQLSGLH